MAKRRMAVIALLTCFCLLLPAFSINAVISTDMYQSINLNQECSLTLSYTCEGTAFKDISVKLYNVAEINSDFKYELTSDFKSAQLIINGVKTNGEWNTIRSTLEAYIVADNINASAVLKTDAQGLVHFNNLKSGLYLAIVGTVTQNEITCFFDSALVALPGLNANNDWQYQVTVNSKSQIIPPSEQEIELKVLKLWKGDENKNTRPQSVEIEIFKDGTSYKKIVLSKNDNWAYTWVAKNDGAKWTVIERNVPKGYTMMVETRDNTIVLTNTYNHKDPSDTVQTGDTYNIMLYATIIIISGSLFVILGIIGKRKSNEENQ